METIVIYQADLGIIGWIIVIVIGTYLLSLFNKNNKNENDQDNN
jgi:glucose uptake protein GlcU